MRVKKLGSGLLVLVMCFGLSGCGLMGKDVVATVNGTKITTSFFNYYLYSAKWELQSNNVDNDPEFWTTGTIDGRNAGEVAKEKAMDEVISAYVIRQEAIKSGNDLTDEDKKSVESVRQSVISSLGGQETYDETLASFGINDAAYLEILTNDKYREKYESVRRKEFNDEELQAYYQNEMRRVKHILIPTRDLDTREELSEEEVAVAKASVEGILSRAQSGEDFDALVAEFSQDPGSASKPDGYLLTKHSNFEPAFLTSALALEEGAISGIVETYYGYHILRRYPIQPEKFAESIEDIREDYWAFNKEQWKDAAKVKYNKSVYNALDVSQQV